MRPRPARLPRAVVAVLAVAAAAACSAAPSAPPAPSAAASGPSAASSGPAGPSTPAPAPPAPPAPATLPLTGLPGAQDRPAVVVKIENSAAARPQRGLEAADLVVEQLVEGGGTRFAAFFHSRDPGAVGPVRSVRNVDAAIAGPTRGVLAFSGGARVALRVVGRADVRLVGPGDVPGAFTRSAQRRAPHNLYLDVSDVWADPRPAHAAAPPPYLPFGPLPDGVTGDPVRRATVRFSGAAAPTWAWDAAGRQWRRSETGGAPAVSASGRPLVADAVLVLRVRVRDAGYRDPAGNPVPESVFTGRGEATLLTGGTAVRGRWAKAGPDAALTLTTASGGSLTVPPGRTWVELLPVSGRLVLG